MEEEEDEGTIDFGGVSVWAIGAVDAIIEAPPGLDPTPAQSMKWQRQARAAKKKGILLTFNQFARLGENAESEEEYPNTPGPVSTPSGNLGVTTPFASTPSGNPWVTTPRAQERTGREQKSEGTESGTLGGTTRSVAEGIGSECLPCGGEQFGKSCLYSLWRYPYFVVVFKTHKKDV